MYSFDFGWMVTGFNDFFAQITGKAVMLDEIINYVQSLQQQVEVRFIWNMFLVLQDDIIVFKELPLRSLNNWCTMSCPCCMQAFLTILKT